MTTTYPPDEPFQRQIFTVTQLNRRARLLLETHLPLLWVQGEISNFSRPSSGHWYFTLKDADAQVRCAMFRNRNGHVGLQPKNGDQVLVRGRVGLYENRGDYQLIVEHLEADGAGLLQQRFEALKAKLQAEGLFDPARKRPLPPFPSHIGLITSPTGAAVRDILHVLKRRSPWVKVSIFPAAVQGSEAISQIVAAIDFANSCNDCDLLIVGRGGGSIEDLWAFNEEAVARAIAASPLPVVSAVGHETDFTIADFVADVRAPTPSAAAELVSPDGDALLNQFTQYQRLLTRQVSTVIATHRQSLDSLTRRLRSPADRLREQTQNLDHLEIRLLQAWQKLASRRESHLMLTRHRLATTHPAKRVDAACNALSGLSARLQRGMQYILAARQQQLGAQAATLNAVSPLNTLERGYAIVQDSTGGVIPSVSRVNPTDAIHIQLRDGRLACQVTDIAAGEPPWADRDMP